MASDKIVVIGGYLSPDMVDEVAGLGIYYGMYGVERIRSTVLNALRTLVSKYPHMKMNFVHTQRVYTKLSDKICCYMLTTFNSNACLRLSGESQQYLLSVNEQMLKKTRIYDILNRIYSIIVQDL